MTYLPAIEISSSTQAVNASIIWLHGLGASCDDFAALAPELEKMLGDCFNHIRFIFPHANEIPVTVNGGYTMPAWYDILDMPTNSQGDPSGKSAERQLNQDQLLTSAKDIHHLIDREIERGVNSERILILGFSQGGAVAYHAALTYPQKLAGLAGLSTYFPTLSAPYSFTPSAANKDIDVQIYHGTLDPVVNQSLGLKAAKDLTDLGYNIQYHDYQMEHQVCYEQVHDIAQWVRSRLA